jgi:hypothetical protein
MPQLQPAGAGLEQERREHEEVLAAHERDLDVRVPPQESLEVPRRGHAAESTAEHDDAHVPSLDVLTRIAARSPTRSDHFITSRR